MNAQEAMKKVNQVGGDFSKLSSGDLYDVFRALQDSFAYSDEFGKLSAFAVANKTTLAADAKLQDKILSEVNLSSDNLADFKNMYEAVTAFSDNSLIRNRFATESLKIVENYAALNAFSPEDLDGIEAVAKMLKNDIDNNVVVVKKSDKKLVDALIKRVDKELDLFVKANDLEDVHLMDAKAVQKGWDAVEKINAELETAEGIYAQEIQKIESLLNSLDFAPAPADGSDENVSVEQFRQDVYSMISEEALRKCALDPSFVTKPAHEQKLALIEAKNNALESFAKKAMLADAVFAAEQKLESGKSITPKDRKAFEKDASTAFEDLKTGKNKKIVLNKKVAIASLISAEKNITAAAKYIAKKTKFDLFLRRAKLKKEELQKKYPKSYAIAAAISKAALKGGTVLAASALFTPLGAGVSAIYAAQATYKSWNGMYKKYKEDPAYQGKKFGAYLKNNKMDATIASATALTGAVSGVFAFAGFVPGANFEAATRRLVRGGAALTVGLASGVKKLVTAKTSKDRKIAWAMMGGSAAVASVAMFFGDDICKLVQEKMGVGTHDLSVKSGGGNVAQEAVVAKQVSVPVVTSVESVVDTQTIGNNGKSWWNPISWGKESFAPAEVENSQVKIVPPYLPGQDPESLAEDASLENVQTVDYSREFDPAVMEKVSTGSYNRSVEYTRTYMQAIENRNSTGVTITKAMADEALSDKLEVFKLISPELVSAAASRGISPEEMYNLAHMEELQFHTETYSRSYSETITLTDGREYKITRESMAHIVKGNCDGLSVEDQLKVVDHAKSHFDMERGGKVIATPKLKGDEWNAMNVKAGIKLNDCGSQDEIEYEKRVVARVAEDKVITEKTDTNVTKKRIIEETLKDDFNDLDVQEGKAPVVEPEPVKKEDTVESKPDPVIKKEVPVKPEPDADKLHIINNGAKDVTPTVIEKGFIPSEDGKGLVSVGPEKAKEYYTQICEQYDTYSTRMIKEDWAIPLTDVHMVSGDGLLEKFNQGIASTDVFPVEDGKGGFKWYMSGGGEMHQALAEKYPDKFGDSFKLKSEKLNEFGTESDVPLDNQGKGGKSTSQETETSKRVNTANTQNVNVRAKTR